jgi:hypothetical protein
MPKDKRYNITKLLIQSGDVKSLSEVFDIIPPSVVARDFGTNYTRFTKLAANPELFRLKEIYTLAELFEVDPLKMMALTHATYLKKNAKRKSR